METEVVHLGKWWHRNEDGKITCDLCPRACTLKDEQRGFCFVRKASDQGMVLTAYGKASGFCIDPIEKKPLNHFFPGTSVLSFGTIGCNLGCQFCQNWEISKVRKFAKLQQDASPEAIARSAVQHGCTSVAFTYNDPVIFAEYAMDTADACRELGIYSVAVTAGYVCKEAGRELFSHMDAANVDLKGFSERFYAKNCLGSLAPVLETLRYLARETNVWLEITTLLIPGENDSDDELHKMSAWLVENVGRNVPLHFTAFHPDFRMQDKPATSLAILQRARNIASQYGLNYVYTGNVHDKDGASTYCPGCKRRVLARDWFKLGDCHIHQGKCAFCATPIAGRFGEKLGNWGAQRVAVEIGT